MLPRSSPLRDALLATVLVPALIVGAAGCKKKKAALTEAETARIAQLKPEAVQKLGQITALAPKVKGRTPTYTDEPVAKKVPPGSYALIGEDYLVDPKALGQELDFSDARVWLCKSAVDSASPAKEDLANLEGCSRLEYAAVIRKASYTSPKAGDAVYTPGEFRGDLLVYHLATGELRGRYALSARNEAQVKTPKGSSKADVEKVAAKELEAKVKSAAADKLK